MSFLRRAVVVLLSVGFLIVATGAAGGLLWALVDTKHAARMLGSNFTLVGVGEVVITLYALGRGITLVQNSGKEPGGNSNYVSHSFRK
jgi:hypothetical protein